MPTDARPTLSIVPFAPGRRPSDEAEAPGLGGSEHVDYVDSGRGDEAEGQELWLLFALDGLPAGAAVSVELSAWLCDDGEGEAGERPVTSLQGHVLEARRVVRGADGRPSLVDAEYAGGARFVAPLPCRALLAAATADDPEPLGFRHLFRRRVRVELTLVVAGEAVAAASSEVEVYDGGRMGSLYRRLLDRLAAADVARASVGRSGLQVAHHPWYPVLSIGMTKADLYMRAIFQDLDEQTTHLPDPRWLLRVGLYLEWLTFLGIVGALGDAGADLLSDEERAQVATLPTFAGLRARIQPAAWTELCGERGIAPARPGPLGAGPVGLDNLLRKERATLGFLHVHHEDLKAAIELAGANHGDAQEAWHRVFRDAERAVLRRAPEAFPELEHLAPRHREFVLWHRRGDFRALGGVALPGWLTRAFGDQDGLFAAACQSYRDSLNDVAAWSKARGLMDYTGERCVAPGVSLIEARFAGDGARSAALQRGDGYADDQAPDRSGCFRQRRPVSAEGRADLLLRSPTFAALSEPARARLAAAAGHRELAAHERVVLEGRGGDTLFVVVDGEVEVYSRGPERRRDRRLACLGVGVVFGERAALTGAPRGATVRAGLGGAQVLELGADALRACIAEHPAIAVELALLAADRRPAPRRRGLAASLGRWLLGRAPVHNDAVLEGM